MKAMKQWQWDEEEWEVLKSPLPFSNIERELVKRSFRGDGRYVRGGFTNVNSWNWKSFPTEVQRVIENAVAKYDGTSIVYDPQGVAPTMFVGRKDNTNTVHLLARWAAHPNEKLLPHEEVLEKLYERDREQCEWQHRCYWTHLPLMIAVGIIGGNLLFWITEGKLPPILPSVLFGFTLYAAFFLCNGGPNTPLQERGQ